MEAEAVLGKPLAALPERSAWKSPSQTNSESLVSSKTRPPVPRKPPVALVKPINQEVPSNTDDMQPIKPSQQMDRIDKPTPLPRSQDVKAEGQRRRSGTTSSTDSNDSSSANKPIPRKRVSKNSQQGATGDLVNVVTCVYNEPLSVDQSKAKDVEEQTNVSDGPTRPPRGHKLASSPSIEQKHSKLATRSDSSSEIVSLSKTPPPVTSPKPSRAMLSKRLNPVSKLTSNQAPPSIEAPPPTHSAHSTQAPPPTHSAPPTQAPPPVPQKGPVGRVMASHLFAMSPEIQTVRSKGDSLTSDSSAVDADTFPDSIASRIGTTPCDSSPAPSYPPPSPPPEHRSGLWTPAAVDTQTTRKIKPATLPKPNLRRFKSTEDIVVDGMHEARRKSRRRSRSAGCAVDGDVLESPSMSPEVKVNLPVQTKITADETQGEQDSSVYVNTSFDVPDSSEVYVNVDQDGRRRDIIETVPKPQTDMPEPPARRKAKHLADKLRAGELSSTPSSVTNRIADSIYNPVWEEKTSRSAPICKAPPTPARKAPPPPNKSKNGNPVPNKPSSSPSSIEVSCRTGDNVQFEQPVKPATGLSENNERKGKRRSRWSFKRLSRGSVKSSDSNKSGKSSDSGGNERDSMGYEKPRSHSVTSRTSWYVDIGEEKKERSLSDSSVLSKGSNPYEAIDQSEDDPNTYTEVLGDIEDTYTPVQSPGPDDGSYSYPSSLPVPPERSASSQDVEGDLEDDYIYPEDVVRPEMVTNRDVDRRQVFTFSEGSQSHNVTNEPEYYNMDNGSLVSPTSGDGERFDDSLSDDSDNADCGPDTKLFYIVNEIKLSEEVFVDVLKLLNEDFRMAVSNKTEEMDGSVIPSKEMNKILNYLPQLQNFNEDLLTDITKRVENWESNPQVADIFVKKGAFLKLYTSYITEFESTTKAFDDACKNHPHFQLAVREFERSERCAMLNIKAYMLKPIQRIPQYKLLLLDYQKHLSPESVDYEATKVALTIVSEVANHANEMMRQDENFKKLLEIQSVLVGQFEVVKPGRILSKKGELLKLSRKIMQPRYFFLFDDVLLYTTPTQNSCFKINNVLPLSGMKVNKPSQEDFQNELSIISVQRSFTLSASTPRARDEWLNALKSAIQEHVNKKISFDGVTIASVQGKGFVVGETAPVWIPDARVTMCMLCTSEFTVTWRRHHCRACGKVVCANCSRNKAPLKYMEHRVSRVCDECYDLLEQELEASTDSISIETSEGSDKVPSSPGGKSLKSKFKSFRKSSWITNKKRPSVLREVTANEQGSDMSGYLKVLSKGKKWKKMWFVLKDKVLYTYKASEDMAAIESRPLLGFNIDIFDQWFEGVEANLVFQISHQGQAPVVFRTESPTAVERWVAAMQEATVA